MKNLRIFIAAFFVSLMTMSFSIAGVELVENGMKEKVGIISNLTMDRLIIAFEKSGNEIYEITISDVDGKTFHKETVDSNGVFSKRYDLEELEAGEYIISVRESDSEITSQNFFKR
jgi:hypothetical protein